MGPQNRKMKVIWGGSGYNIRILFCSQPFDRSAHNTLFIILTDCGCLARRITTKCWSLKNAPQTGPSRPLGLHLCVQSCLSGAARHLRALGAMYSLEVRTNGRG